MRAGKGKAVQAITSREAARDANLFSHRIAAVRVPAFGMHRCHDPEAAKSPARIERISVFDDVEDGGAFVCKVVRPCFVHMTFFSTLTVTAKGPKDFVSEVDRAAELITATAVSGRSERRREVHWV